MPAAPRPSPAFLMPYCLQFSHVYRAPILMHMTSYQQWSTWGGINQLWCLITWIPWNGITPATWDALRCRTWKHVETCGNEWEHVETSGNLQNCWFVDPDRSYSWVLDLLSIFVLQPCCCWDQRRLPRCHCAWRHSWSRARFLPAPCQSPTVKVVSR